MNIGELAKFRGGIATDTISEVTSASGVTIDSVICKDGSVTGAASGTFTTTYVKAADTQGLALVNSSGTSVVTVSDAGAVTAGQATPGAVDIVHTIRGYYLELDNRKTAASQAYFRFKAGGSQMGAIGATTTNCFELWNAADNAKNAECSNAGAWTLGPASGLTTTHYVRHNGTIGTEVLNVTKTAQAKNQNNNFYVQFTGSDGADGYLQTNGSGVLGVVDVASDERLKTNIRENLYGLSTILSLRPITFDWKDGSNCDVKGFIAQEVQTVLPESVMENPDGFLSMETHTMIPVLVAAMKEQQALIEALQAKVAALEAK